MPNTFNSDGSPDGDKSDGLQYAAADDEHELVSRMHGQLASGTKKELKEFAERHGISYGSLRSNKGSAFLRKVPIKKPLG